MLKFEGKRLLGLPPEQVFAKLSDAQFLVPSIPDVAETRAVNEADASLVLRPGFSFVRGTLDVIMQRTAVDPTGGVIGWLLTSKGIGSSSAVEATLTLSGAEAGTSVLWVAEVKELGGLLKWVPGGLIRGAAEQVINNAWDQIEKALADS